MLFQLIDELKVIIVVRCYTLLSTLPLLLGRFLVTGRLALIAVSRSYVLPQRRGDVRSPVRLRTVPLDVPVSCACIEHRGCTAPEHTGIDHR